LVKFRRLLSYVLLCGYLTPSKGSLNGRLRNFSPQQETAPLPYKSANNGLWSNNNVAQPVVWYTQIAPYLNSDWLEYCPDIKQYRLWR
jgi:hypothetical protein